MCTVRSRCIRLPGIDQNLPCIFPISSFRLPLPHLTKDLLSPNCLLKYCVSFKAWIKWTVIQKYSPGNPIWKNYLIRYVFLALHHSVTDISTFTPAFPELGGRDESPKGLRSYSSMFLLRSRTCQQFTSLDVRRRRRERKMSRGAILRVKIRDG